MEVDQGQVDQGQLFLVDQGHPKVYLRRREENNYKKFLLWTFAHSIDLI